MTNDEYQSYGDEELISLIAVDDSNAFTELYNRYWIKAYRYVRKKIQSEALCEEIVQDLFTNIWSRRKSLRIQKNFGPYFFTSLRNMVLNHYQALSVQRKFAASLNLSELDHSTEKLIDYLELFNAIEREIEKLPDRRKHIFRLSRNEGLSILEIAQHLKLSPKTVENQIGKALKHFKVYLKDYILLLFLLSN